MEQLKQFVTEDPGDPFNWYALALEYLHTDQNKSLEIFEKLLREHASYIPTYYHAGKLYLEFKNPERAIDVFEKGIVLAKNQNNIKTLNELRSALDELEFE